jgi:hypothetical protein
LFVGSFPSSSYLGSSYEACLPSSSYLGSSYKAYNDII